jgi:putative ABC transport system substrate-binding protein
VTIAVSVLGPKRLELLLELVPTARIISLLVNPRNPNIRTDIPETQRAAEALGRHLELLTASTENEIDTALATIKADALLVMPDPYFLVRRHQIVALTARYAMPAIYPFRECVDIGGLISYGSSLAYLHHQMGMQAGKILKGATPADLPIQQSIGYELVINLKTAKALGLTVPCYSPAPTRRSSDGYLLQCSDVSLGSIAANQDVSAQVRCTTEQRTRCCEPELVYLGRSVPRSAAPF